MSQQRLHLEPSSMNSLDITKQMESMSTTDRVPVVRHNKRLPQSRYSPYTLRVDLNKLKEKQKEESIRLGVELSLIVAEAMFLLSDDLRSMLLFCFAIWKFAGKGDYDCPVVGRLIRVIHYVFVTYIKPKNGVYHDGAELIQFDLIKRCPKHFNYGVGYLGHFVTALKMGLTLKLSSFELCKQELKMLEDIFKSVNDVSVGNGFAREAIESNILHFWKSLFEAPTPEVINHNKTIILELFRPMENEDCWRRLASLNI